MKRVCIVVLNYNNYEDTIECIRSVKEIDYPDYEIVLVDNCSTNNSVEELKKEFKDSITHLNTQKNLGYAGGNNVGLKYAVEKDFDYLCVLNNDTVVRPDFLSKCVEYLENNSEVAIVSPIVLEYSNDKVQSTGGVVLVNKGNTMPINNGESMENLPAEIECDYISGACMVFRKELIQELGFIPENYFLFYEETEWCYRAKKNGYKNICISSTYIRHKGSVSIDKIEGLNAYLISRNRVVFCRRNLAKGFKFIFFLLYLVAETLYRSITKDKKYFCCFPAYFDGLTNRVSKKYPFIILNDN